MINDVIEFLLRHGYAVLFVWVFIEQMGLPLPSAPLLFAAGALAGEGFINPPIAFGLPVLASLLSGLLWYEMGRRRGHSVLSLICRISFNPESCVRRTADLFSRHGARSLLVAKFIPGLSTVAPPLAGIFRMSPLRFLLFNGLGAIFWTASFTGLGYLFSDQIEEVAASASRLGALLAVIVIGGLAAFIIWKYVQRQRFLQFLRIPRITPEELKKKLDAGEDLLILDVRHPLELKAEPRTIPGARYLPLEQLDKNSLAILPDREVVLYCQ